MPRVYNQLLPGMERRLSAWIALNERHAGPHPQDAGPTITISRRFGCEGFPLAEQLKAMLDDGAGEAWTIFDKALLEFVAEREPLSPQVLADLGGPSRAIDTIGPLLSGYVPHSAVFQRIPKHMVRIAEAGHAIIVGRGGAIIAQKLPNCFHFRLEGSFEFRVASLARRLELPEAEARKLVRANEEAREAFIEECLGVSPTDPALYDAVFNNGRHGVAEIARAVVAYVREAWAGRTAAQRVATM